jgi:transposase
MAVSWADRRGADPRHAELLGWARHRWPGAGVGGGGLPPCHRAAGTGPAGRRGAGGAVPPRLLAGARHAVRVLGKSDPIDALAVARAGLREPDLPTAGHDQASWEVKLLVDHREQLIAERTSAINRLRWQLHRLDPTWSTAPDACPAIPGTHRRLARRGPSIGPNRQLPAAHRHDPDADHPHRPARPRPSHPGRAPGPKLLSLPGGGVLTAAGSSPRPPGGPVPLRACFAMDAGVAPIPASSGRTDRHRLGRGGNRQLHAAIHRIAITQLPLAGPGQSYSRRRRAQGDSTVTPSAPSSDLSPARSTSSSS